MDAETDFSLGRARAGVGGVLLHTLRFCQRTKANQAGKRGQHRNSSVKFGGQFVQEVVSSVPPGNDSDSHQLVYHAIGGI